MNPTHIVIDGKVYKSVDEMPADVRARYEQAASLRQKIPQTSQPSASVLTSGMKFIVDGQEYHRLEDLPPEARAKYEQAMAMLDKNQNGMPDFLEGMPGVIFQTPAQPAPPATSPSRPASRAPQPASPSISPDTSSGVMLILLVGLLLMLCLATAVAVWYFFLR